MWDLIATAAAGLNAGAGLQAAMAGAPSAATDSVSFARFAGRSRLLSLLLSTVATSSCVTAYYGEARGALWLAAAAGVGIGIPFNLLMMSPPTAVVSGGMRLEQYGCAPVSPRVHFAQDEQQPQAAAAEGMLPGSAAEEDAAAAAAAGEAAGPFANGDVQSRPVLSSATASIDRRRRLMYSKSGMLVSPTDFASSWAKKYWFSAALSLTAFGCMMAMMGTGKDAATYGYAPY